MPEGRQHYPMAELEIERYRHAATESALKSVDEMTERLEAAFQERLTKTTEEFREQLEANVRSQVDKITAPLTHEMLSDTVGNIAKSMVAEHSAQNWRVREIVNEGLQPVIRNLELLARRVGALETAKEQ